MIADIGLIVAAYVIFRTFESLFKVLPGGPHEKISDLAQGFLVLIGIMLLIVTVVLAAHIVTQSANVADALDRAPVF